MKKKPKPKQTKTKKKPTKTPQRVIGELARLIDLYGPSAVRDKMLLKDNKLKPVDASPKALAAASQHNHDLDERIRLRIARLNGTFNGRRLYLTPGGDVSQIAPALPRAESNGSQVKQKNKPVVKLATSAAPPKPKSTRTATFLGQWRSTQVLKALGQHNWCEADAAEVMHKLGADVAPATVATALRDGRNPTYNANTAKLTPADWRQLEELLGRKPQVVKRVKLKAKTTQPQKQSKPKTKGKAR